VIGCASEIASGKIDVLCGGSRAGGILDINAGKPAGGFVDMENNITAKIAPRGVVWDNIFVVNGRVFDNIFIYFTGYLTIKIWSKTPQRQN